MPWTLDQFTEDELRQWLASRKEVGKQIDVETCEIGWWYVNMVDEWDAVDLDRAELSVVRVKNGKSTTHPLSGKELRWLRRLKREQEPTSAFVFVSERGAPFAPRGFRQMIERLGAAAKFEFPVHAHMLRHACGYKLVNDGHPVRAIQDYMGHRNIQHTVRYTELAPARFKNFWND
jgi:site-specific recombinase XerD